MERAPVVDSFIKFNSNTNRWEMIEWRRSIIPAWLTFNPDQNEYPLNIPVNPTVARANFFQPKFGVTGHREFLWTPFEGRSIVFADSSDTTASANFTVEMIEVGESRRFMNAPIHIRNIAGTAQFPALLREAMFVPSLHNIQCLFQKISGSAVNMRMAIAGCNYFPYGPDMEMEPEGALKMQKIIEAWMERRKYVWPFFYTTDQEVSLSGNGSGSYIAKVGDGAHFEAMAMVCVSTGDFSVEIQEVKQRGEIMNAVVTRDSAIGTAQLPTIFPVPYLIPADSKILFKFTDLSGSTNRIDICLQGRLIRAPIRDVQSVLRDTAVPSHADTDPPTYPSELVMAE